MKKRLRRFFFGNVDSEFYEENKHLLDAENYSIMVNFYRCLILLFFSLFVASFFVPSLNKLTLTYLILNVTFLLCYLAVLYFDGEKRMISFFFYFAYALVMSYTIYSGTFRDPAQTGSAVLLIIVVPPILYIEKPGITNLICIGSVSAFIICSIIAKKSYPEIIQFDIIYSVTALVFAMFMIRYTRGMLIENIRAKLAFEAQAQIDKLTGAYNKSRCETLCTEYIESEGENCCCAVLSIDVDNFKHVNDSLGHAHGDEVLRQTGMNLRRIFRDDDIVGRNGGDEFVVLMKDTADTGIISKQATLINRATSMVFEDMLEPKLSCSIGIYVINNEKTDYHTAFQKADEALYFSKENGKGCYTFFE